MIRYKLLFVPFLLLSIICSCRKDIGADSDFQGEWHSYPVVLDSGVEKEKYLIINGNDGIFGEWCSLVPLGSNCSSYFSGKTKINRKKSKIFIGSNSIGASGKVTIEIDVPPHINSEGKWECTLTERIYIRK